AREPRESHRATPTTARAETLGAPGPSSPSEHIRPGAWRAGAPRSARRVSRRQGLRLRGLSSVRAVSSEPSPRFGREHAPRGFLEGRAGKTESRVDRWDRNPKGGRDVFAARLFEFIHDENRSFLWIELIQDDFEACFLLARRHRRFWTRAQRV